MSEWKRVKFTDLLSTIIDNRGRTCPTTTTGIPLIATNCIVNDSLYPIYEKIRYVSQETYDTWFRGHPIPGDLLFVTKGTPGRVCVVPDPVPFCVAQDMVAIRANPEIVYPKYLFAALRSVEVQDSINNLHVGTLIPHFKKGDFDKLFIPLPSPKLQKIIGDIYYSLSEKIELNTRINKVLEEIAQTLFKRWFVDFEFPDVNGKPYKSSGGWMVESEMGMIPEGWEVGTIGDIATQIFSGGTPNTSTVEYWGGEYSWFSSGETRNHFVINTEKAITKLGIDESSTRLAKKGDILIASAGQGFTRGQTSYLLIDTYINQSVVAIRCPIPYQLYIYENISGRYDELRLISDGSSIRGSLTTKMLNTLPIIIPPLEITEEFTKISNKIIQLIENNLYANKDLIMIRDMLLPKLMRGDCEGVSNI